MNGSKNRIPWDEEAGTPGDLSLIHTALERQGLIRVWIMSITAPVIAKEIPQIILNAWIICLTPRLLLKFDVVHRQIFLDVPESYKLLFRTLRNTLGVAADYEGRDPYPHIMLPVIQVHCMLV